MLASCADHPDGRPEASGGDRGAQAVSRIQQSALHTRHAIAEPAVPCAGCHELVGGEYLRAASWRCLECHATAPLGIHASAPVDSEARECWSCHSFTAASDQATPCASCHAKAQGALPAIGPHDPNTPTEDCGGCHAPHQQPTLVNKACESCHREPVSGHDKPGVLVTGCASCHGYHEPAALASERCTNCHRQSRGRVPVTATFAKGHVKCVTCHRQHRFVKTEALGCRDECHAKQVAISETRVKAHSCLGCHDKHDVGNAALPMTCETTCHAGKVDPTHPKDAVSKTRCLGCHKPHRPGAPPAVACASCHTTANSDRAFHQGARHQGPACQSCHEPHDFKLAATGVALCRTCHGDQPVEHAKSIRTHAKHDDCFSCHGEAVGHQPDGPRVACATCHDEEASVVHAGHTDCVGCHEPHTTTQQAGCESCHAAQAATAPTAHQQCTSCHDQHSTLVKKKCGACHADRTTGVHAPVACSNCHRAHGPAGTASPPACTTCHKDLPFMHEVPNHQECKSCHRSHGEQPYLRRAACLACHEDRKNHEPTAPTCIGCHTFGGAK